MQLPQYIFKRYEKKYLLSSEQYNFLTDEIKKRTVPDKYGESDVCNIYFDTPDYRIIRASIQKPVYKEKLRLRCYGTPNDKSKCFLEIKKKYKGVVYKRRIMSDYLSGYNFLTGIKDEINPSQIKDEILYFKNFYNNLSPKMNIFYKRIALYDKDDYKVRFTFDKDIKYKTENLDLRNGISGEKIIPDNNVIMEIKTIGAMPLWTVELLNMAEIYPTSFSKYGTAYMLNKFF